MKQRSINQLAHDHLVYGTAVTGVYYAATGWSCTHVVGLLQASDTVNTQNDRNPYDECAVVSTRDDKSIRGPFQAPHSPISGRGSSIRDVEIEPKHGGDIEGGSDDGSRNHDGFANDDNVRSGSIRIHGLPTGVMTEEEFTDAQAAAKSRAVQLILSDWVEPSVYGHVSQSV